MCCCFAIGSLYLLDHVNKTQYPKTPGYLKGKNVFRTNSTKYCKPLGRALKEENKLNANK